MEDGSIQVFAIGALSNGTQCGLAAGCASLGKL